MAILISLALRMLSSAFWAWAAGASSAAPTPAAASRARVRRRAPRRAEAEELSEAVIARLLGRQNRRPTARGWNGRVNGCGCGAWRVQSLWQACRAQTVPRQRKKQTPQESQAPAHRAGRPAGR